MVRFIPSRFLETAQARAGNQMAADAREAALLDSASKNMSDAMEAFAERERRADAIEDVRNALNDPNHTPSTMEGIQAQQQAAQRSSDLGFREREMGLREGDSAMRRSQGEWERGRSEAADRDIVNQYTDQTMAPIRQGVREMEALGMPVLGMGTPPPGMPSTREGVEFRTKLDADRERERRMRELGEMREGRLSSPRPMSDLDRANVEKTKASIEKMKAETKRALERKGRLTDNAAMNAAVKRLDSQRVYNEETMKMESVPWGVDELMETYETIIGARGEQPGVGDGGPKPVSEMTVEEIRAEIEARRRGR